MPTRFYYQPMLHILIQMSRIPSKFVKTVLAPMTISSIYTGIHSVMIEKRSKTKHFARYETLLLVSVNKFLSNSVKI